MGFLGKLFNSEKKQTTESSVGPWAPQQPYIKGALGDAEALYQKYKDGLDPRAVAALEGLFEFGTQDGVDFGKSLLDFSNTHGLSSLTAARENLVNLYDFASQDGTQSILDNAALYANNPYADDMIDAVNRDVTRSLGEDVLPGLNRAASSGGNLNSSRAGAAEAIATRGARDRVADTAATIRSGLFDNGLRMAATERQNRFGNMMGANGALMGFGQYATGLGGQGINTVQGAVNGSVNALEADKMAEYGALNNYWNIVSTPLGQESKSTTTQKESGNYLGKAIGMAAQVGSMFSGMPSVPMGGGGAGGGGWGFPSGGGGFGHGGWGAPPPGAPLSFGWGG
ncbi:hypothetical protein [Pyruvatibacter mobilis]|uniref:hypothetical protein n=1 Tax=Pyruvatibacter mobilis TaxID=1712261 RepID=UPI003BAA2EB6